MRVELIKKYRFMTWRFTQLQLTFSEVTSVQNHALFWHVYNRSVYIISIKPRGDSVLSWQRIAGKNVDFWKKCSNLINVFWSIMNQLVHIRLCSLKAHHISYNYFWQEFYSSSSPPSGDNIYDVLANSQSEKKQEVPSDPKVHKNYQFPK